MIDSKGRNLYQTWCIAPLLRLSWLQRLPPKYVTLLACICGVAIFPLLLFSLTYFAILFLLLSGFLDTLDGSLARATKTSSPQGAVLDITCDRFVECAIVLGLYSAYPETRALPSLFMLSSILLCVTTFLVVGIFNENQGEKSFYYSPGLIERTEAFFFFFAMILLPSAFTPLAYLFTALVLFTAAFRVREFLNSIAKN